MSKEFELRPCPSCGTQPVMVEIGNDHTKKRSLTIRCPKCRLQRTDAAIQYGMDWLRKAAAEGWNNQPYLIDAESRGRTLGRREMKGKARLVAISAARAAESIGKMADENTTGRDRMFARSREASSIADAIEAIPEEVEK